MQTIANTTGAHRSQARPRQRPPRYLYTTPCAGMALLLACLMVIPIPRMLPIPHARADGADGTCNIICTRIEPPICTTAPDSGAVRCTDLSCDPDPNDLDCFLQSATSFCFCNDGTAFNVQGEATPSTCNTSATCLNHCGPYDPLQPENVCYGGPPIQVGGCELLQFFNGGTVCSAAVRAFDPDTGAVLVNQSLFAGPQLLALEAQAIDEVLQNHGLPATERTHVTTWARDLVRAQLFTKLVTIINTARADRTADQQLLYDWLTNLVWQKRIDAAQGAWRQFLAWRNSVNYATCAWHSPNETGIVEPQGTGTITKPGCSPGVDGIPGNDPTSPLVSLSGDIALGLDDGETCFQFHNFRPPKDAGDLTPYYDSNTLSRCTGAPTSGDIFGLAAHPTLEEFMAYGYSLARQNLVLTPGFASVVGNTYKAAFLPVALGTAGLAAGLTGAAIYSQGGWQAFAKVVFPYALREAKIAVEAADTAAKAVNTSLKTGKASFRLLSAIGAASVVFEVVFNILTAIEAITAIVELNSIPPQLKEFVRKAAGTTETTFDVTIGTGGPINVIQSVFTGKPDLAALIQIPAGNTVDPNNPFRVTVRLDGKEEIFYAFLEAVSPEIDLADATAPEPDSTLRWSVRDASTNQIVPLTPPHLLPFLAWDANEPWNRQTAGLYSGWFDVQTVLIPESLLDMLRTLGVDVPPETLTSSPRVLDLGIDYQDCAGKERRAWRVAGNEFVSVPLGTTVDDVDLTKTTRTKEFQYLDWAGQCRIARINQAPTATITAISSTRNEGQPVSLSGTGTDADGDTVSLVWNFGDGTGTITGASVLLHAFLDNGTYTVTLTPTDAHGVQGAAATQIVTIANVPPTVTSATLTEAITEGQTASLAVALTDLGVHDSHTVIVDWGDGSSPSTAMSAGGHGGGSVTFSHVYGDSRAPYSVAITVTDKDGGTTSTTKSIRVDNVAPTGSLQLSAGTVPEGTAFSGSFTSIVDPSPVDTAAGFQYAFDCGSGFGAFSSTNAGTCTPTDNGPLTVTGRVKDKDGGMTDSTATITVTNVAPTATFTATAQLFQGESATLAFSNQFDPSPADTQAGFSYAYDCTTNGTVSVANTRSATATCTYLKTGTFTAGGTITDKDQGATKYTATVAVLAPQQATTTLISQVQALASQGVLNSGQTNGLTVKLTGAIDKLNAGKNADAVSQLQSFISQVNDLVNKDHILSPAQGQSLTSVANRISAAITVS